MENDAVLQIRSQGLMAQEDIKDHKAGRCQTSQLVLAACRAYYLARASDQDAEGYRAAIEKHLGFPLPLSEDWTYEQWMEFVAKRKQAADESKGLHRPILN